MKKFSVSFVLFLFLGVSINVPGVYGQTVPTEAWIGIYDWPGCQTETARAIAVDKLGNVYAAGAANRDGYNEDAVVKYDKNGTLQWTATYKGGWVSYGASTIAVDKLGNVYVAGATQGEGESLADCDYLTIKYDKDGNELWVAKYAGAMGENDFINAMDIDRLGNVFVTGMSYGAGLAGTDIVTIKYDAQGNEIWVATYDGPSEPVSWDEGKAIAMDAAGGVYVTGWSGSTSYDSDYVTIKYDKAGNEIWAARYNGPGDGADVPKDICLDVRGNVYVTGVSGIANEYWIGNDFCTIKYDADGNQQWVARYDGPDNNWDEARHIVIDTQSNIYVTGLTFDSNWNAKTLVTKYDTDGSQVWVSQYDSSIGEGVTPNCLAIDKLGDIYVAGQSQLNPGILKINGQTGAAVWLLGNSAGIEGIIWALALDLQKNIHVAGEAFGNGQSDFLVIKFTNR